MSTQLTRLVSPSVGLAVLATLALAACNRGQAPQSTSVAPAANAATTTASANSTAEMSWARAAIERNPDLEVIATDPQTRVLTVKHRSTGEVEAIKANELAAVTPSQLKPMEMRAAPPPEPEPAPAQNESMRGPSQTAQATAPDNGSAQPGTITSNGAYTV